MFPSRQEREGCVVLTRVLVQGLSIPSDLLRRALQIRDIFKTQFHWSIAKKSGALWIGRFRNLGRISIELRFIHMYNQP